MACGFACLRTTCASVRRALDNLHQVEIAGRVFLEALQHGLEHLKRFFLVLDQRIVLAIAAQADALLEVIHAQEVIFPLRVENAEHDHALVMAHGLGADQLFFRVVALFQLFENRIAEFLPVQVFRLHAFRNEIDAEASEDRVFQAFDVPVVSVALGRAILFHQVAENR